MLWDGLLPSNEIALLAGIAGYGKSTLVRQLAVAIVRGESHFLTRPLNAPNRRVIYVCCEDGQRTTSRILKSYGGNTEDGLILLFASQLSLAEVLSELADEVHQAPVDLIVIDSLGNLLDGEQNSNSDAQGFYSEFAWFAERTLVLFLHHVRKGDHRSAPDQVNIRERVRSLQRARAVLMLTGNKHSTERHLHMEKENDVSDLFKSDALLLEFDRHSKRYSSDGETKPVSDIGRPPQDGSELESLFLEGESELPTAVLVDRMRTKYSIERRAAMDRLKKSGLVKSRHGFYARSGVENVQSADSAKVECVQKVQPKPTKAIAKRPPK